MADQWYYAREGQQAGPVPFAQLSELARTRGLKATDLVWQDGMPEWKPAGEVAGLFSADAGQGMPAPQPSPYNASGGPVPAQPVGYAGPYQPQYQAPPGSVPNYLWQSIVVTILCCPPFGIPGIVYAAQVNGKLAQGDYQGAIAASKNAKMWSWIAFGAGLAFNLIGILLLVAGAVAA